MKNLIKLEIANGNLIISFKAEPEKAHKQVKYILRPTPQAFSCGFFMPHRRYKMTKFPNYFYFINYQYYFFFKEIGGRSYEQKHYN